MRLKGACLRINKGNSSFWFAPWIRNSPDFKPSFNGTLLPGLTLINQLLDANGLWNRSLLAHLFDPLTIQAIFIVPIGNKEVDDDWFWPFNSSGLSLVKSGFNLLPPSFGSFFGKQNTPAAENPLVAGFS